MWLLKTTFVVLLFGFVLCEPAEEVPTPEDVGPQEAGPQDAEEIVGGPPRRIGIVYLINVLRGSPRDLSGPAKDGDDNSLHTDDFQKHPQTGLLLIRPLAIITGGNPLPGLPSGPQSGPVEEAKAIPERLQVAQDPKDRRKRSPGRYGKGGGGGAVCAVCQGGGGGGYPGGGGGGGYYPGGGGGGGGHYPGGGGGGGYPGGGGGGYPGGGGGLGGGGGGSWSSSQSSSSAGSFGGGYGGNGGGYGGKKYG